jgi:hypothetical protein
MPYLRSMRVNDRIRLEERTSGVYTILRLLHIIDHGHLRKVRIWSSLLKDEIVLSTDHPTYDFDLSGIPVTLELGHYRSKSDRATVRVHTGADVLIKELARRRRPNL